MSLELRAKDRCGGGRWDPIGMNLPEIAARASPKERGSSAEAATMRRLRAIEGEAEVERNCG